MMAEETEDRDSRGESFALKSSDKQQENVSVKSDDFGSDLSPVGTTLPGKVVKTGFLSKKARAKFIRPWTLRNIILDEHCRLFYYDRDVLKGVVSLLGTGVRRLDPAAADGRPFAFEIVNINDLKSSRNKCSSLVLAAGSQREADEWIEAIHSMTRLANRTNQTTEYQTFADVAKQSSLNAPVDLKRLKEERKMRKQQQDHGNDVEDDEFFSIPIESFP